MPYKKQLIKNNFSRRNYTTAYMGLPPVFARKLNSIAKSMKTTESAALRKILGRYFKDIEKKGLPYEPLRKFSPIGMKVFPRTISKEQDRKLRELTEKTGRGISELMREAVERY